MTTLSGDEGSDTNLGIAVSISHLCPTLKQELDEIKMAWWRAGRGRGRETGVSQIARVGERREGDGSKTAVVAKVQTTIERPGTRGPTSRIHGRRVP